MDTDRLLPLIEKIYDAAVDVSHWEGLVNSLADAFSGSAALFSQHYIKGNGSVSITTNLDPDWMKLYQDYYGARKPWLSKMDATTSGSVVTSSTLIDKAAYEKSEYFNDWVRPQGFYHLLGAVLHKEGSVATTLAVLRPNKIGSFDDKDIALCQQLTPHLLRAIQVQRKLFAANVVRDGVLQGIDNLSTAVIIVNHESNIIFANSSAENMLSAGDVFTASRGRLRARRGVDTERIDHLVYQAAMTASGQGCQPGGVLALTKENGDSVSVLVSPLKSDSPFGFPVVAAILFISCAEASGTAFSLGALREVYGLSPAEAKLMSALLNGSQLQSYALDNGISVQTVKSHLKKIFDKTGQSRQSDLLRAVLSDSALRMAMNANK